ncbi:MAG: segregation and condensation protein B [Hyphomonadaceae bacterium]|nr:MAG: segregation and condensation protein B [Hyphomonadaceae bacterium]
MADEDFNETDIYNAVRAIARKKDVLDLADAADALSHGVDDGERMVEALLFASQIPMRAQEIAARLGNIENVGDALARLKRRYIGRGVTLVEVAGAWRFQTAVDLAEVLAEHKTDPKKLSRAALETLAIIAYHQPCTRSEIEEIRGVSAGRGTLDLLIELKWVRPAARRRSPGKPLTYRTTDGFLAHFNLAGLDDLPGKAELQAQGLLSANLPKDFEVPKPSEAAFDADLDERAQNGESDHNFAIDFFED